MLKIVHLRALTLKKTASDEPGQLVSQADRIEMQSDSEAETVKAWGQSYG